MRAPSSPYCRLDLAPPSADRFIFGVAPIDYGPVVLLIPLGFHLAMDTLPSEELTSFFGQRGITPAFGYGPPHPSARRTSTFLNNALLSTQYASGLTRIGLGMTFTRCSEVKFSAKENGTK